MIYQYNFLMQIAYVQQGHSNQLFKPGTSKYFFVLGSIFLRTQTVDLIASCNHAPIPSFFSLTKKGSPTITLSSCSFAGAKTTKHLELLHIEHDANVHWSV